MKKVEEEGGTERRKGEEGGEKTRRGKREKGK